MRIEIESAKDYLVAKSILEWIETPPYARPVPCELLALKLDLAIAMDDYREIYYPCGGEPNEQGDGRVRRRF